MTLDWDGKIRMDCSSPYAMASLIAQQGLLRQIATGNDADSDRHGIVTPDAGLMNPNHYLAVAIHYLWRAPSRLGRRGGIGKTLCQFVDDRPVVAPSSGAARRGAGRLQVVRARPDLDGSIVFGGEESAGASFLRKDGTTWTTDKDGILLACSPARSSPSPARPRASTTRS
jgi:phosphoglucomutase